MSAAPPAPTPHRSSPYGGVPDADVGAANGVAAGEGNAKPRTVPHVRDLVAKAEEQVNPQEPIGRLIETGETALNRTHSLVEFGRPELAYIEYLVAIHIVASVIPKHKDAPTLQAGSGTLSERHRTLIKRVTREKHNVDKIEEYIKNDNLRSGVQPIRPLIPRGDSSSTTLERGQNPNSNNHEAESSTQDSTPRPSISSPFQGTEAEASRRSSTPKPPVHPKPQNLQSSSPAARKSTSAVDALSEKISRLRHASSISRKRNNESPSNTASISNDTDSPQQSRPGSSAGTSSIHVVNGASTQLPVNGVSQQSRHVRHPSLSKELPKPPSPTYLPSRSVPTGTTGQPSQSSRNSLVNAPPSDAPNSSAYQTTATNGYPSAGTYLEGAEVSNEDRQPMRRRRQASNIGQETEISAERLYDYLKTFNVLLIDVRSRDAYDAGHIWAKAGICVEPTALRMNMSAEELQDALILSPDLEQAIFDRRNEFDLVVYFDQSTQSTAFLTRMGFRAENAHLRFLHDALLDFNQEKPLRFPPILLVGGIDGWTELLGPQALQTSNTAARVRDIKNSKPTMRRTSVAESQLNIQRKRHRDYNPLAPEEEQKWRERARSESIVLDQQKTEENAEAEGTEELEATSPSSYEAFNSRFPEVSAVERQLYASSPPSAPPSRPLPDLPSKVPSYPTMPMPSVPSRPPPAVPRPSYSGVSERISQGASTPRTTQLAPYIPPKLKRLPRTGLHNFGVTCYMNATIQCLSATIPLTAFFLDGQFNKFIQKENWKGSSGLMPEFYSILLRHLWQSPDVDTIRPTNFRKFCARLNKEWGVDRQQDAKEFLEFLVDTLHEDLNVNWARNPLRALTAKEEAERERTPPFVASKREWDRYQHRDWSRLTDLFAGQHISKLTCTTCGHTSTTYEPFYSISIEIPRPKTSRSGVDVYDCLRSYCSAETLSGEEVWRCPRCRAEREATKRITISRAPEFLVLHFKRFSASHTERARKVHTPVDFPLRALDLEPFMLAPPARDRAQADYIAKRYGDSALAAPPEMTPPHRYDAYAVMRHLGGTMSSGHYVALVQDRARNCWREFNDDRITDFKPEDLPRDRRLQNEQAYIVFYQRVHEHSTPSSAQ